MSSNLPPGADKDPQAPWKDNVDYRPCEECEGHGYFNESDCCGASIKYSDICSNCGEHCETSTCTACKGEGEVPVDEQWLRDLYEQAEEEKMQIKREEEEHE